MDQLNPKLIDLETHVDDRGRLYEVWRQSWKVMGTDREDVPQITQVYMVHDEVRGVVRAFHRHEFLWDAFCIVSGSAKFYIIRGEANPFNHPSAEIVPDGVHEVTLNSRAPKLLVIPPTLWHGWVSLEDNTTLLSLASNEYNHEDPDEERVSPSHFRYDFVWGPTTK